MDSSLGRFDLRRVEEEPLKPFPLLWVESPRPFAKWPHCPCDLGVFGLGQGALEPLEFLLTHRIGTIAVGSRHMEPINDDLDPGDFLFEWALSS